MLNKPDLLQNEIRKLCPISQNIKKGILLTRAFYFKFQNYITFHSPYSANACYSKYLMIFLSDFKINL